MEDLSVIDDTGVPVNEAVPQEKMPRPIRSRKDAKMDVLNNIQLAGYNVDEPRNVKEALTRPDGELWQRAINDELSSI
ncbi:hypothetical protein NDN08_000129 [Rhodosorus marinus]|uniref:UBA domain-containing protein n=1 Tax=Rhodosorus marinus TaxID=101924 RepID=A0AAV8UEC4_9RHOD|nr:hypothetical protein NDN08_000129 [Rhodosorus marinus]